MLRWIWPILECDLKTRDSLKWLNSAHGVLVEMVIKLSREIMHTNRACGPGLLVAGTNSYTFANGIY